MAEAEAEAEAKANANDALEDKKGTDEKGEQGFAAPEVTIVNQKDGGWSKTFKKDSNQEASKAVPPNPIVDSFFERWKRSFRVADVAPPEVASEPEDSKPLFDQNLEAKLDSKLTNSFSDLNSSEPGPRESMSGHSVFDKVADIRAKRLLNQALRDPRFEKATQGWVPLSQITENIKDHSDFEIAFGAGRPRVKSIALALGFEVKAEHSTCFIRRSPQDPPVSHKPDKRGFQNMNL
jgi:hypothetical protein